jgi:hypothetical protein
MSLEDAGRFDKAEEEFLKVCVRNNMSGLWI